MQVLSWSTPIGWAIFIVSVAITTYILSLALRAISTLPPTPPTPPQKKK
jgi:hypothetical protein